MTDMTAFLQGHIPPADNVTPFDHSRKVECRALVRTQTAKIEITEELTEKICDMVAAGKSLAQIGAMEGLPSYATLRRWVAHEEGFRRSYAAAKETLADDWLVETVAVADDSSNDYQLKEGADGIPHVQEDRETLGRSKLRIDTRFRAIAKLAPSKYGDVSFTPAVPAVENRNGDGAKVIDGEVIPIERHPLFESVEAWGKVANEAK